jgi:hypothetical protein
VHKASDRAWLAGLTVGLGLTLVAAYAPLPPSGGTMCAYLGLLLRAALYLRDGGVLTRLFQMGIVAGLFELPIDWWLIHGISNGRLDYLGAPDVVLLASPIWMPLAWACVIVELGYPAVRLSQKYSPVLVTIGVAISAGVTIGFYEYFAYRAGWWKYAKANVMIGDFCAAYIPLGEAFMFLAFLPVARRLLARGRYPLASAVEAGASFALAIFGGYALAYAILELGRTP